jgi:hypothetical protein
MPTMTKMLLIAAAAPLAALLVGGLLVFSSHVAKARTAFATETGKPCGFCHSAMPKLNDTGQKFKANGYKL